MESKVSVIIITFNHSQYIIDCLKSVLNQNFPHIEIIVVDDGSTDGTKNLLTPYLSRIVYIYQDNNGPACARNTGIQKATGDFIVFLDSDDILGENYLPSQIEHSNHVRGKTIPVCRNYTFSELDKSERPIRSGRWRTRKRDLDTHLLYFNIAPPHSFLYTRSIIDRIGLFNTEIRGCEDYEFILRASAAGYKFIYNKNTCVFYRKHIRNRSKEKNRVYLHDMLMHLKILDLHQKGLLPAMSTMAGRYAYCSGLLTTAERLPDNLFDDFNLPELLHDQLYNLNNVKVTISNTGLLYYIIFQKRLFKFLKKYPTFISRYEHIKLMCPVISQSKVS